MQCYLFIVSSESGMNFLRLTFEVRKVPEVVRPAGTELDGGVLERLVPEVFARLEED